LHSIARRNFVSGNGDLKIASTELKILTLTETKTINPQRKGKKDKLKRESPLWIYYIVITCTRKH